MWIKNKTVCLKPLVISFILKEFGILDNSSTFASKRSDCITEIKFESLAIIVKLKAESY